MAIERGLLQTDETRNDRSCRVDTRRNAEVEGRWEIYMLLDDQAPVQGDYWDICPFVDHAAVSVSIIKTQDRSTCPR